MALCVEEKRRLVLSLKQKINLRLDTLQNLMESNYHLQDPTKVYELILNISKFWSILSEEDREYVQGAQYAIEDKMIWKSPEKTL